MSISEVRRTEEYNLHIEAMNEMTRQIEYRDKRIAALEAALRAIAEHPHCDSEEKNDFLAGYILGHRCAAEIAKLALEGKP